MILSYFPFIFSIIFFLICLYISSLTQILSEKNSPYWIPSLPDIGHRLFPYYEYYRINDHYLTTAFVTLIIRYIFQINLGLIIFRRCLFLQGILLLIRSISISVTSLSVPLPNCTTTAIGSPPIEAFYIMFSIHYTCGDILFSGHAVTLTLCALAWTTYSKGEEYYPIRWLWNRLIKYNNNNNEIKNSKSRWFYPKLNSSGEPLSLYITTLFIWIYTIIGYILLIATRFHYTVDVFLAYIISKLTWKIYHYYIKNLDDQQYIIVNKFLIWFEGYEQISDENSISILIQSSNLDKEQNEHIENLGNIIYPSDLTFI